MTQYAKHLPAKLIAACFAACIIAAATLTACSAPDSEDSSSPSRSTSSASITTMPSVKGLTTDKAKQDLEHIGLNVVAEELETEDAAYYGKVIDQAPAKGAVINRGETALITVGKPKEKSSSSSSAQSSSSSASTTESAATEDATSQNESSSSSSQTADAAASSSSSASETGTQNETVESSSSSSSSSNYDTSQMDATYAGYYDQAQAAISSNDPTTLAYDVVALYQSYPDAGQALVDQAKTQGWYSSFQSTLNTLDPNAAYNLTL